MEALELFFAGLNIALRELTLFAACGFLVLGFSDLFVDLIWLGRALWKMLFVHGASVPLPRAAKPGLLAIFIPVWDEADVIGDMLRHALSTLSGADYRIYVGCYPNDPQTIAVVSAHTDPRIRTVIGLAPGPTTKADCLNRLWERMLDDEARGIM